MVSKNIKGRFAPSPSGRMHLGNVYAALLSWLSAKSKGGEWLLRIEDLDPQRCKLEYALQLEEDLRWLGLNWDEGGTENRGSHGPYMQSLRNEIYEEYLAQLQATGLTYQCHCTRADIKATQAPHESDGRIVYKGTCRPEHLKNQAFYLPKEDTTRKENPLNPEINHFKATTRLFVPDLEEIFIDEHFGRQNTNLAHQCGDFILRRKDGAWAYQLAVVVDDALMGVTEVVRGRDLLLSSAQQIYLFSLLHFDTPTFCHHPLICNEQGQRLCKRDKSLDLGVIRQSHSPEDVIGLLSYHAGIIDQSAPISLKEALREFSWSKVPMEDVLFHNNLWK